METANTQNVLTKKAQTLPYLRQACDSPKYTMAEVYA